MNEHLSPPEESGDQAPQGQPGEPEVPVEGDFEVRKVIRLPEDPEERRRVRQDYAEYPHVRRGLGDTGVGQAPASRGQKGKGNVKYD
jgi:hypothetical protein